MTFELAHPHEAPEAPEEYYKLMDKFYHWAFTDAIDGNPCAEWRRASIMQDINKQFEILERSKDERR